MLPKFTYVRPTSLEGAVKEAGSPGARIHAGGTDLLGCLWDRVFDARKVVSLSGLKALRGIDKTPPGGLRIGALTTIADVSAHPVIGEKYAVLAQAAAAVASPQLRNQATIGGNLCQRPRCWYFRGDFKCLRKGGDRCFAVDGENENHAIFGGHSCYYVHPSDIAPALAALDASIRIAGPAGVRTVPVDKFFVLPAKDFTVETVLRPAEIVTDVLLPASAVGVKSGYRKVRSRGAFDFALVGLAYAIKVADGKVASARLVLSGVAPAPWRLTEAEKALAAKPLSPDTIAEAVAASVKGAEPLSQNAYKVAMVKGIVEEGLTSL